MVLNSDRYDEFPKGKAAARDCVEQMRHKSDPMDVGEMSHQTTITTASGRTSTSPGTRRAKDRGKPRENTRAHPRGQAKREARRRQIGSRTSPTTAGRRDTRQRSASSKGRKVGAKRAPAEWTTTRETTAQDLGDLELCAVEEVARASAEQIWESVWTDLPLRLGGTINEDARWVQFLGPVPMGDPWSERMDKDISELPMSEMRWRRQTRNLHRVDLLPGRSNRRNDAGDAYRPGDDGL